MKAEDKNRILEKVDMIVDFGLSYIKEDSWSGLCLLYDLRDDKICEKYWVYLIKQLAVKRTNPEHYAFYWNFQPYGNARRVDTLNKIKAHIQEKLKNV